MILAAIDGDGVDPGRVCVFLATRDDPDDVPIARLFRGETFLTPNMAAALPSIDGFAYSRVSPTPPPFAPNYAAWDAAAAADDDAETEERPRLPPTRWGSAGPRMKRVRGDRGRRRLLGVAARNAEAVERAVIAREMDHDRAWAGWLSMPEPRQPPPPPAPRAITFEDVAFVVPPLWAHPHWALGGIGDVAPKAKMRRKIPRVWRGKDLDMIVYGRDERLEWARKTGMFLARARTALGDRRLHRDAWGGSVLDSVIGAMLTQNVSDVLSSSAIMNLAARFPGPRIAESVAVEEPRNDPPETARTPERPRVDVDIDRREGSPPLDVLTPPERDREPPPPRATSPAPAPPRNEEPSSPFASPPGSPPREANDANDPPAAETTMKTPIEDAFATPPEYLPHVGFISAAVGAQWYLARLRGLRASDAAAAAMAAAAAPSNVEDEIPEVTPMEPAFHVPIAATPVINTQNDASTPLAEPQPRAKKKTKTQIVREELAALAAAALETPDPSPRPPSTRDLIDWNAVLDAPIEDVVECIRCRGMHFMLARRIKNLLRRIASERDGALSLEFLRDVPTELARGYLLSLEGYGVKTVSCILLLALYRADFPVDVNVGRIMARLGWVPLETEQALEELSEYAPEPAVYTFLRERLNSFGLQTLFELHYHMITMGKVFCEKRTPNCRACPLQDMCEYASCGGKRQVNATATGGPAASSAPAAAAPPPPPSRVEAAAAAEIIADVEDTQGTRTAESIEETLEAVIDAGAAWDAAGRPPAGAAAALRLDPGASWTDARAAHAKLSRITHPDKCDDPRAARAFAIITAARNVFAPPRARTDDDDVLGGWEATAAAARDDAITVENDEVIVGGASRGADGAAGGGGTDGVGEIEDVGGSVGPTKGFAAAAAAAAASIASSPLQVQVHRALNINRIRHELTAWSLPASMIPTGLRARLNSVDETCYLGVRSELPSAVAAASRASTRAGVEIVPVAVLVPCRAAMYRKFPLHGTYFQTNEVFLDSETAVRPELWPIHKLSPLPTVSVYLGTSVASICRGMSRAEVAMSFGDKAVCVRSWDRDTGHPRPLPRWACPFFPRNGATALSAPGEEEYAVGIRVGDGGRGSIVFDGGEGNETPPAAREAPPEEAPTHPSWVAAAAAADLAPPVNVEDDDEDGGDDDVDGTGPVNMDEQWDRYLEEDEFEDADGEILPDASPRPSPPPPPPMRPFADGPPPDWNSRVLMEYAARRRAVAEAAAEASKLEKKASRKRARAGGNGPAGGAGGGGSAASDASGTDAGSGSSSGSSAGRRRKRKWADVQVVSVTRFFSLGSPPS